MKLLLTSFTASLLFISASAQITLTSDHIATLGDTIRMAEDTINGSSLNMGAAAGNQTWDFSGLQMHDLDTVPLEAPSTAPLSSNFPSATFVVNDLEEDSNHIFFERTLTALDFVGLVEYENGSPTLPDIDFSFRFMQFPVTFGSVFSSSLYAGEQIQYLGIDPDSLGPHPRIDSIRTKIFLHFDSELDAWGDMILPQGTFPVLRQAVLSYSKYSSDAYMNGSWQPFTPLILTFADSVDYDTSGVTYRWWSDNPAAKFFVAEIELDSNELPENSIEWMADGPANYVGIDEWAQNNIQVYPNPVSNQLNIVSDQDPIRLVTVLDAQGREVIYHKPSATRVTLDVGELSEGVYLVLVYGETRDHPVKMEKIKVSH